MNLLLSALSGILLALLFPKFNLFWLAWVALVPLFLAIYRSNYFEAIKNGFICGFTFFAINLFWVTTLSNYVGIFGYLVWLALVLFQSLFIVIFTICAYKTRQIFLVPLLWVILEWLRSLGPYGVTSGALGYSQVQFLPLAQMAAWAGIYGISFLIVLINLSIVVLIIEKKFLPLVVSIILVILIINYGCRILDTSNLASSNLGSTLKLALIQGSVDQKTKLDPHNVNSIFALHEKLSYAALAEKPDIIVWPETAIFTYLLENKNLFLRVQKLARDSNAYLLIGTPYYGGKDHIYNSIVAISPQGNVVGRYDKERLVPFGEYLPLRFIFYPFLRSTGFFENEFNTNKPSLLNIGKYKVGSAICFESTFSYLIKERAKNADFIVNVTNDAWFLDSAAPYMHFNWGTMRAIENRKYFIQAGNHGISGVIDPYGRVLSQTKVGEQKALIVEIALR